MDFYADNGRVVLPEHVSFKEFYFAWLDELVHFAELYFFALFFNPCVVIVDESVNDGVRDDVYFL